MDYEFEMWEFAKHNGSNNVELKMMRDGFRFTIRNDFTTGTFAGDEPQLKFII